MSDSFVLAHVTDPHLSQANAVLEKPWFSKRRLSLWSWQRNRRFKHRRAVADAIAADLCAAAPDAVAVTGDLTNFGMDVEYADGAEWLASLGPKSSVAFVPGNHDAMVPGALEAGSRRLVPWLTGDDGQPGWPWLRRRGPLALIGLNTAIPTRPFSAAGWLGDEQLQVTAKLLKETKAEGRCRVVLLHHPPSESAPPRKGLRDRAALRQVLAAHGAELVLHGHNHLAEQAVLEGPDRPILVLGAPSASMAPGFHEPAAAWRALRLERVTGDGWRLDVRERGVELSGRVGDRAHLIFSL